MNKKYPLRWKLAQYFELLWWKNYLKKKSPKEYLSWKTQYWRDFLSSISIGNIDSKADILDAGCGPAGIYTILHTTNNVDALDPLIDEYSKNLNHFDKKDYPNVSFHKSSLEKYDCNKQYDMIFCINVINHVVDIEKSIEKLGSLLKSNGKLIISIDAHNYKFLKYLFRLIPGDILHPHQYDIGEYEKMLINQGFRTEKIKKLQSNTIFDYYVLVAQKPGF